MNLEIGSSAALRNALRQTRLGESTGQFKRVRFLRGCTFGGGMDIPKGTEGAAYITKSSVIVFCDGALRLCAKNEIEVFDEQQD